MKKISLRTLVPLIIAAIIIAPSAVILPWFLTASYHFLVDKALSHERLVNEHLAHTVSLEIKRLATVVAYEATMVNIAHKGKAAEASIPSLLSDTLFAEPELQSLYFIDDNDKVLAFAHAPDSDSPSSHAFEPASIHDLKPLWGHIEIGPVISIKDTSYFTLVSQTTSNNAPQCRLVAKINTKRLWETVNSNLKTSESKQYLIRDDGLLLGQTDAQELEKNTFWSATHAAAIKYPNENASTSDEVYIGRLNQPVFGITTPIAQSGLTVLSEISEESISSPILSVLGIIMGVLVVTLLGGILVITPFVQRMIGPLYELGTAFGEITVGAPAPNVSGSWLREIDTLVAAFKKMLANASNAELRFNRLFNNADLSMQIYDSDGTLLAVNQAHHKLWGATINDIPDGYNIFQDQRVMQSYGQQIRKTFSGTLIDLPPHFFDLAAMVGDSDAPKTVTTRLIPVHDSDAQLTNVVAIHHDVTEVQEAQQVLQEQETRFQAILDQSSALIYTKDLQGRFTLVNRKFANMLKLSPNDVIGKTLFDISSEPDAATHARHDDLVLASGQPMEFLEKGTIDGKTFNYLSVKSCLYDEDNNPYAICGVSTDIQQMIDAENALTRSRQLLQAILDNSPSLIFVKDLDGRFLHANATYAELFNKTPAELIGQSVYQIFPTEVADRYTATDKKLIQGGRTLEYEETAIFDDEQKVYLTTKFLLKDDEKNIFAVACISTDITLLKQQEERLRDSQKMDALGKLTGGVAHDYNNALGVICGFAEILQDQTLSPSETTLYASKILQAAQRGSQLSKKLLAFTRHTPTRQEVLDISEFIHENRTFLEQTMTARIQLNFDLNTDLWFVRLDRGDLGDSIINLCINAMHAMPSGGEITVKTENTLLDKETAGKHHLAAGQYVAVSVSDTGIGMSGEIQSRIFDPFFSTKGAEGTGLGLSQLYGFVKRSNGAIKVVSELDHGSCFTLYLPRNDGLSTPVQSETNEPESDRLKSAGETILIVDDEPDMCELARLLLSANGYKTLTAANGVEALEILAQQPVHLVLSDIIMPKMDGFELAATINANYPTIKVLMVSGFGFEETETSAVGQALQADMIVKPYKAKQLLTSVSNVLKS